MLKVNKREEPEFLLQYRRRYKPKSWDDYDRNKPPFIKSILTKHMLLSEQEGYCPYCERKVNAEDDSHIEHIKPRDKFPNLFQDYYNLLVCCNDKKTCGSAKKGKYEELFLNPVLVNPTDYLTYNLSTGELIAIDVERAERSTYTIDLLNLNERRIKQQRLNLINVLIECSRNGSKENFKDIVDGMLLSGSDFLSLIHLLEASVVL